MTGPLLRIEDLLVTFRRRAWGGPNRIAAVNGVTLELSRGKVLGIIGESGSGKSTTARAVLGLVNVSAGRIIFDDEDITHRSRAMNRRLGSRIQAVFQDVSGALDPRMTVRSSLRESLRTRKASRTAEDLLEIVGLSAEYADRFPHSLSGGQRQRIGIARALAVEPELLLLDEPTASLDVSIQAQTLNLLASLRRSLGLTMIFIGHNIAVIRYLSDEIAVMHDGRVVEYGSADEIVHNPQNQYTRALVEASMGDPRYADRERSGCTSDD